MRHVLLFGLFVALAGCRADISATSAPAASNSVAPTTDSASTYEAPCRGKPSTANPLWVRCESDSDCTAIPAICGGISSVNGRHAEIAARYERDRGTCIDCALAPASKVAPVAGCRASRCVIVNHDEMYPGH